MKSRFSYFKITACLVILLLLFTATIMAEEKTEAEPGEQDKDTETIDTTEKISEEAEDKNPNDMKDKDIDTKEGKYDVVVDPLKVYGK
ncbi:MAG: hypothetical protein ACOCP5_01980 [Halanaerobiaceae bacterium]